MNFKDLYIKSSYETGKDNLLEEFYIPVLLNAVSYDRIAGFFSSSSLAIAAKGIIGLIRNGGRMRIIACPKINKEDFKILNEVSNDPQKFIEKNLLINMISEDMFINQHIYALGWLIANNLLEIKIALLYKDGRISNDTNGIFHQKVGILRDKYNNYISFSGSINESATGWLKNIEEFKVFKSWKLEQSEYFESDINKFDSYWNNKRNNVKVIDLPVAVKNKFIELSQNFNKENIVVNQYKKEMKRQEYIRKLSLFSYQKDAIEKWKNNNRKLIFQMATGTGKTRTAIGCIIDTLNISNKLITIISCPQSTLSLQWKNEIDVLEIENDISLIVDGTNKKWRIQLKESLLKLEIDYYDNIIIYTTHKTSSKEEFTEFLKNCNDKIKILFIGDEVHGLGSLVNRQSLLDRYDYRIGLSATPSRWFDDNGTILLEKYFGDKSYEFSISDALTTINPLTHKTFLVNYYYYISFVELDEKEMQDYKKLSIQVTKLKKFSKRSDEYEKRLENLLFKRANIIKNAEKKYNELEKILKSLDQVKDLIIFVSNEQIDRVLNILSSLNIPAHKLTQNEKTIKSDLYGGKTERQDIIDKFKKGYYKVLVAIRCLDEGIDIPSATSAILMASSSNPREYVQRIGRVIRQSSDKKYAYIYDISIKPCLNIGTQEFRDFERMIVKKERNRLVDICKNALNNAEALEKINSVLEM